MSEETAVEYGDGPQRYAHPVNCYRTAWNTWYVQLQHEHQKWYLGTYETLDEAVEARDLLRVSLGLGPL